MPVSLTNDFVVELLPIGDLRPLPGVTPPTPEALAELVASLREHGGLLVPLVVRPARCDLVVQEGWRETEHGWFVLDPRLRRGDAYQGDPPFFPTREAARRALPADVPWEVVKGCRRLAAAKRARLELLPCLLTELDDVQVRAVRTGW